MNGVDVEPEETHIGFPLTCCSSCLMGKLITDLIVMIAVVSLHMLESYRSPALLSSSTTLDQFDVLLVLVLTEDAINAPLGVCVQDGCVGSFLLFIKLIKGMNHFLAGTNQRTCSLE